MAYVHVRLDLCQLLNQVNKTEKFGFLLLTLTHTCPKGEVWPFPYYSILTDQHVVVTAGSRMQAAGFLSDTTAADCCFAISHTRCCSYSGVATEILIV